MAPNSENLNPRQKRFVDPVLTGMAAGRAYEQAGYNTSRGSADTCGARLLRNARVSGALKQARSELEVASKVERHHLISYLTSVMFTPIGDLDSSSPLIQEISTVVRGDAQIFSIKMISKIEAAKLLCKIMGWYKTDENDGNAEKLSKVIHFVRSATRSSN